MANLSGLAMELSNPWRRAMKVRWASYVVGVIAAGVAWLCTHRDSVVELFIYDYVVCATYWEAFEEADVVGFMEDGGGFGIECEKLLHLVLRASPKFPDIP